MRMYKIKVEEFNKGCNLIKNDDNLHNVDIDLYDHVEIYIVGGKATTIYGVSKDEEILKGGTSIPLFENIVVNTEFLDFLDNHSFKVYKQDPYITKEGVLKNLQKLIGTIFDYDEIVCAFGDFEEDGEDSVYVGESHNAGYDYIAYINAENSTCFLIQTDKNDKITDVRMD